MINVGIIGCGFVGGILKDRLEHNNQERKLFFSDPNKEYNDVLSSIDIVFLQIHKPTEDYGIHWRSRTAHQDLCGEKEYRNDSSGGRTD